MKSCQVIASGKFNLLRKVDFLLESGFQFFYSFGGRIPCYNCRKLYLQMSMTIIFGTCLIGLHFQNIFPIGGSISLWSRGFTIFQSNIPK